MTTTIVHDTTEAVRLCPTYGLFLKPIAKMMVSVALPQLKQPGKSISNWEVMERIKSMVHPDQFSTLRISKSTMEFIRFEGEVENRGMVKTFLAKLDGKSIKLSGFTDILKVRSAENKMDFPTRHDWDSFFRDAKDMTETLPGERPDTIRLEGLPCKWFAQKDASTERPSESVLKAVFEGFGRVRKVDIPMLDPYREEMLDKNFHTFTFGGHLNFEAYVQYQEYAGFVKAMDTLRGMKLMYKAEDSKAVACNIKVTFDTTKHLSDWAVRKRQVERLKLQELERQREEQKRREKEEEERRREEERKQRQQEEEEKERRREEKIRKREQKIREREEKKTQRKVLKQQAEEQKKLHQKIAMEERKLLLAQRNLESIRLIAELLGRAKALKQQQQEKEQAELALQQKAELARLQQLEEKRRLQEAELRRVEDEKARALELQRKERELRDRLLGNLLKKSTSSEGPEAALGLVGNPALAFGSPDCQTNGTQAAQVNGLLHAGRLGGYSLTGHAGLGALSGGRCGSQKGLRADSSRERRVGEARSREHSHGRGDRRREHSRDGRPRGWKPSRDRSRDRRAGSRERSRGRGSRERSRGRGSRERHRERSRGRGERSRERSRGRGERSRERSRGRGERSRERSREHSRGRGERSQERSRGRGERSREHSRGRGERSRGREERSCRDRDRDRDRGRSWSRSSSSDWHGRRRGSSRDRNHRYRSSSSCSRDRHRSSRRYS
ncbi:A-kinase anchor protein 17A [Conger conger]|uniref:A-kinase anchor protein 17A n=1 Tax=Conger conger TaxID=82655 RepID=UPI002A5A1AAD|nr:A-kinase anchor protein 17A [Conger conger]XP_061082172.1 A-kinase anchor protein 17A [Conger conger]